MTVMSLRCGGLMAQVKAGMPTIGLLRQQEGGGLWLAEPVPGREWGKTVQEAGWDD